MARILVNRPTGPTPNAEREVTTGRIWSCECSSTGTALCCDPSHAATRKDGHNTLLCFLDDEKQTPPVGVGPRRLAPGRPPEAAPRNAEAPA